MKSILIKDTTKKNGNCEIYRVECSDGIFGVPESVFRIKKLLF